MSTNPTVCIVESLGFLEEQSHREGEIISQTLQLSGKRSAYVYIKSIEDLKAVAREFGASKHRYLHLSCHGAVHGNDKMVGLALTTGLSEILCAGPGFHQVLTKRSSNMMANWVLASAHSRGGIFHC